MKIFLLLPLLFITLYAKKPNFITDVEYGKMLYQNPRGIGCNKCHGENGEGKLIAEYEDLNKTTSRYETKYLRAPAINRLKLREFGDAIINSKGVMPSYFLTKEEIITLYKYVNVGERNYRKFKKEQELKKAKEEEISVLDINKTEQNSTKQIKKSRIENLRIINKEIEKIKKKKKEIEGKKEIKPIKIDKKPSYKKDVKKEDKNDRKKTQSKKDVKKSIKNSNNSAKKTKSNNSNEKEVKKNTKKNIKKSIKKDKK